MFRTNTPAFTFFSYLSKSATLRKIANPMGFTPHFSQKNPRQAVGENDMGRKSRTMFALDPILKVRKPMVCNKFSSALYLIAAKAASSASTRSSMCSVPIESLMVFGFMPCSSSSDSVS